MFSSKTNFSMLSICFWDNILSNKQVKHENNGIPKKVPIMEDRFFGTVENITYTPIRQLTQLYKPFLLGHMKLQFHVSFFVIFYLL